MIRSTIIKLISITYCSCWTLQLLKHVCSITATLHMHTCSMTVPCIMYHVFNVVMSFLFICSIWFWVKDPSGVSPGTIFSVARDNVYLAIVLLGMGGATVLVLSYTMISQLVGRYSVCWGNLITSVSGRSYIDFIFNLIFLRNQLLPLDFASSILVCT